jgi:hypothetical protein
MNLRTNSKDKNQKSNAKWKNSKQIWTQPSPNCKPNSTPPTPKAPTFSDKPNPLRKPYNSKTNNSKTCNNESAVQTNEKRNYKKRWKTSKPKC